MARRKRGNIMPFAGITYFQELSNGIKIKPSKFIFFVILLIIIELVLGIIF